VLYAFLHHKTNYPWRCLCFAFGQITLITPFLFTILHLSQILLTEALTFIFNEPTTCGIK